MVGGCWMVAHVCRKTQLDLGGGVSCASRGSGFTGLEGRNGGKGGCGIGEGCWGSKCWICVCVCVCVFPQFCRYLKGKPNNRLKLRGKNRQLERIDVFPVEIFVYLHVVDRLWCRLCIEVIPETAAKNACYSAFHSTNNQQQTTLIASNKQQPAPFSFTRILYFRKEWSPTTPSAALKSLMVYWSENLRFLGLWPLKSYRNPIGKDRFFQPPYFRGELLNFGGVTSQPWQQCSVVVFHHRC